MAATVASMAVLVAAYSSLQPYRNPAILIYDKPGDILRRSFPRPMKPPALLVILLPVKTGS
jgi:hypothetical protein